ncbi:DUF4279 domain-containing protein [Nocardia sp. NPDC056000]|uniref:DUF4279 domain-containing protein n=1 Tax=Nocardia sp. NPDC056000 TaxID=3345674 RepID=UPI0035E2B25B
MKTRQYCYFKVHSFNLSTADLTARLGIAPDEQPGRISRSARKAVDRSGDWRIVRTSDESIDDQIQHLIDRLNPIRDKVISLCREEDVYSVMQVVRYFHDPDGVRAAPGGTPSSEVRNWPRPLGWNLSVPVLEFLTSTGSSLDVDEYDLSGAEDE